MTATALQRTLGTDVFESPFPSLFPKAGGAALLRPRLPRALRRRLADGRPIELGSEAEPFVAVGNGDRILRRLLERLASAEEGCSLRIVSFGSDLAGHAGRLARLDRDHAITIDVPIPSLDPLRAHRLDPTAPSPYARLGAIDRLSRHGLAVRVLIPAKASAEATAAVAEAAASFGAIDLVAAPSAPPRLAAEVARLCLVHGMPRAASLRG